MNDRTIKRLATFGAAIAVSWTIIASHANAADVLDVKVIGTDLARDIANGSVKKCAEEGYAASAVVVDRNGDTMVAIRGDVASRFTLEIAAGKARAVILSGAPSKELRANRGDIRPELNHLEGILVMDGGLPIESGGFRIGAVGVSGAPTGAIDEACAQAAIDDVFDRIGF